MTGLDLRDPMVRELASLNHLPEEEWTQEVGGASLVSVTCRTCHSEWPCQTVRTLRQLEPHNTNYGQPVPMYPEEEETPCPNCGSLDKTVVPPRFRSRGPFCNDDWHDRDEAALPQPDGPSMNLLVHDPTVSP